MYNPSTMNPPPLVRTVPCLERRMGLWLALGLDPSILVQEKEAPSTYRSSLEVTPVPSSLENIYHASWDVQYYCLL